MYNLVGKINDENNENLSQQQIQQIRKAQNYLSKHKIHEICNQLVAKLIETRSEKVKEQMISILKKMKEKTNFFKKSDFQAMFDSYDIFDNKGNGQIPYIYLMQSLTHVNVHLSKQQFLNAYPQFKLEKGVKKSDFVSIMDGQYKKKLQA